MKAGVGFALGLSPERIDPGNQTWTIEDAPKAAELAKLLENTFRHVNIALVNQLLVVAIELGIDL